MKGLGWEETHVAAKRELDGLYLLRGERIGVEGNEFCYFLHDSKTQLAKGRKDWGGGKHENLGRTKQTHKKPGKNETILYHPG